MKGCLEMKKYNSILRITTLIMMIVLILKLNLFNERTDTVALIVDAILYVLIFLNIILVIYYFIKKKKLNL